MTPLNPKQSYLRLTKHKIKKVELNIIKNVLNAKSNILEHRKRMLKEKHEELNNVNYNVWNTEDKFCNQVWNFSLEHNFMFLYQYQKTMESNKLHKCRYSNTLNRDAKEISVYKETTLTNLKQDIDAINNEITSIRNKCIEKDINDCRCTLANLKIFTEKILKIISLVNNSEKLWNVSTIPTCQVANKCSINVEFTSAKKLFKKSNSNNGLLIEKNISIISNEKPKGSKDNNIVKFGKFVMKKQSIISLKHEETSTNFI